MLGREAVIDRYNDGLKFASEFATENIEGEGIRGKEDKSAAVKVDEERDGEVVGSGGRDEKAEPEVARGIDDGVASENAVARGGGGGDFGLEEGDERAIDGHVGAESFVGDEGAKTEEEAVF